MADSESVESPAGGIIMKPLLSLFALCLLISGCGPGSDSPLPSWNEAKSIPLLVVQNQLKEPVLSVDSPGAGEVRYGFEGGRVVKVDQTYHLFTSEMAGDPVWVKMRLGHWSSPDGVEWTRRSTLFESSGNFDGTDPRASLWSPLPVYDDAGQRWNLFYVAYHSAPNTPDQFLSNQKGRIFRAVSRSEGREGIAGPYEDRGVVMEPGEESAPWEGLQGVDSFFPYRVEDRWFALYGSARTESLPIEYWKVGLAEAREIAGPWKRVSEAGPLPIEDVFIENPIVTRLYSGVYIAVYDSQGEDTIGYTYSHDGLEWEKGRPLKIQSEAGRWAADVRTPLGLVPEEDRNVYTLFYSGFREEPDWDEIFKGNMNTTCAIGKATLRIVYESTDPYKGME